MGMLKMTARRWADIPSGGAKVSEQDRRLEQQVLSALSRKLETEAADIHPIIQGGKVILSGVVDVYADKAAAEDAIRGLSGVREIENDITVVTDGSIDDRAIKTSIEERLRRNDLPVVGVDVHSGNVHLQGKVQTLDQKNGISASVQEVMGVKSVSSTGLKVASDVDDATITNLIERALVNSGLDAMDIHTQTHHGVAVMMGWVGNEAEWQTASQVAAEVAGVKRVVNRLRTRS